MIPPDQFIFPAEQTGLIHPLTTWILEEAARQCLAFRQAGYPLKIAVNLSTRNLMNPRLPEQISTLLQRYGLPKDQVRFEITESAIMTDPERALVILARLQQAGIRFSIDDFGTGYSSLAYLKKLPVDELKVDRSFIEQLATNAEDSLIVRSTIEMAHKLGLQVVAEGVETQETWDRLVELDCDAAQGFYMCKPLPAAELTGWLNRSPWALQGESPEQGRLAA
jgi:EAL domain-containing protein (putative c-di-GMP-specific phosphodiesterase class I)